MYAATVIDSSSTNIPTSFDETAGSLAIPVTPAGNKLLIINLTTHTLAFSLDPYAPAPSSSLTTNPNQCFVPPGDSTSVAKPLLLIGFDISQGSVLYLRSADGSAASSGKVFISIL